jgi:hypothetical protein
MVQNGLLHVVTGLHTVFKSVASSFLPCMVALEDDIEPFTSTVHVDGDMRAVQAHAHARASRGGRCTYDRSRCDVIPLKVVQVLAREWVGCVCSTHRRLVLAGQGFSVVLHVKHLLKQ